MQNSAGPQPGGEPVDQRGHAVLPGVIARQFGLPRRQRLGAGHRQANRVEAEAGVERVGKGVDPFGEQAHHRRGIARRQAGFHLQPATCAIAAFQYHDKAPPPDAARFHLAGGLGQ